MSVQTQCSQNRNFSTVTVDVNGGQYLKYEVCVLGGAANDAIIVSLHEDDRDDPDAKKNVILDEDEQVTAKCREREWPANATITGRFGHTILLTFARATGYRVRVTLHEQDGSIRRWIKDCTYKRSTQADVKRVRLTAKVK